MTLHLYVNDAESQTEGGATTFHSLDMRGGGFDVLPLMGRVLVFQQRGLLHSGADVVEGVKLAMRTELMFGKIEKEEEEGGGSDIVDGGGVLAICWGFASVLLQTLLFCKHCRRLTRFLLWLKGQGMILDCSPLLVLVVLQISTWVLPDLALAPSLKQPASLSEGQQRAEADL